jgi:polysaccharide biosynthesis/export protein
MTRGKSPAISLIQNPIHSRSGVGAILAAFALVLVLAGCVSPFDKTGPKFDPHKTKGVGVVTNLAPVALTNQAPAELLQPMTDAFTLGPGDKIELELIGDPGSRALVTVGPDGKIYFYLLPGLDVWGLTLAQTKALIEREMTKYLAGAQVAIALRGIESKRIWLLGRLHNAGIYPIYAPITLLESISTAGGLITLASTGSAGPEQGADLERSFVVREGRLLPVDFNRLIKEGDMSQNIYLKPDDFVYVPSTVMQDIYVLGAVRAPRTMGAAESTTLISAIANAGGTIKDAHLNQVGVIRGSLAQPKIAVVSYKDIVAGKTADVRLQPGDIVYVPFTPYRNLVKYADLIMATFARAVAINEGARAVTRNAAPAGVTLGIGIR